MCCVHFPDRLARLESDLSLLKVCEKNLRWYQSVWVLLVQNTEFEKPGEIRRAEKQSLVRFYLINLWERRFYSDGAERGGRDTFVASISIFHDGAAQQQ